MTVLTEIPLPGEGGDRAFRSAAGNIYRARLRVIEAEADITPANGGVDAAPAPIAIAPTKLTLNLSLSLLDEDLAVQMVGDRYRIFDDYRIVIPPFGFEEPGFDLAALIEDRIADRMAAFDVAIDQQASSLGYLSTAWGIGAAIDG